MPIFNHTLFHAPSLPAHFLKRGVYWVALVVVCAVSLTLYAWQATEKAQREEHAATFHRLALESEKALMSRLEAYEQSLKGAKGLFQSLSQPTRSQWRSYVEALDIQRTLPGINGVGWIADVKEGLLPTFIENVRADKMPDFKPHPAGQHPADYVITYIEPLETNRQAVGLNIAFEKNRYEAALLSRDQGEASITKRIFLVQDADRTPGFLLLLPMYKKHAALQTLDQRRAAFTGWIYAPFIARNFMRDLTHAQGVTLRMKVFDGQKAEANALIFDSHAGRETEEDLSTPVFEVQKQMMVKQQPWTILWCSTDRFEAGMKSFEGNLVLGGGLALSGLMGAFMLFFINRARAVQQLVDERTEQLRASSSQLQAVMNTVVDGIVTIDEKGKVLSFNPAAERMFGYSQKEIIGRNVHLLMPEPNRAEHDQYLADYLNTGLAKIIGQGREVMAQRKDGQLFPMELSVNAMMFKGRRQFVGTLRDISQRQKAESEREALLQELQASNADLERFAYVCSHDLQEPLRKIQVYCNQLEHSLNFNSKDDVDRALEVITRSVRVGRTLVTDLLRYSKMKGRTLDLRPFNLLETVEEVVGQIMDDPQKKGDVIRINLPQATVKGDATLFRQVMQNLVLNALKYKKRDQFAEVDIYSTSLGDTVKLYVEDKGIGFDIELKDFIFEPFKRLVTKEDYEGSGIGLAFVKSILDKHGWPIDVKSKLDVGTQFIIQIPRKDIVDVAASASSSSAA